MELISETNCTGCAACISICPKGAIEMQKTSKGFFVPHIDTTKCVECGLCVKTCPENNVNDIKYNEPILTYLAKNEISDRKQSSSGGMFILLAKKVVELGGTAYGAMYDEQMNIVHGRAERAEELKAFRGSKYVQSFIGDIYTKVLDDLKNDRYVYFSGTACQVSGLINYLNRKKCDTKKLITQDIICHGVGSPRFFDDYKKSLEKKYKSKIIKFNFRGKPMPGKWQNIIVDFENGKQYIAVSTNQDIFYHHFFKNLILKPSCFECKYANVARVADISLGDCYYPKNEQINNDGWGISYMQLNTEKGKQLFESIRNSCECIETDYKKYIQANMQKPSVKSDKYDLFWDEYETNGYKNAIKKYGNGNIKGAIKRFIVTIVNKSGLDMLIKKFVN
ncbi:Coenzyme F420-reducing hydrogenase, beta subunit [Pseudobutyrivibrio sp. UC1225]|uniref:Coenzyme F420 hydrogenase/dehydrogenase, beta subunit C-terminal domain n=1 Tax=Pseudobutyrivibrio sp. UC1225 TaxID=1798185 RepID=UPI0008E7DA1E|nr:Coenzyme F420 hydrogenase/dehydrogenase, beta subunit C-terminal domain [Pseudobutyrivibrio sp. UC1225]SFO26468.1 Coenzyme F420-reducing hydrogenase, beta subunit [Pseudobutyrivibrio sp. UC1225]